MVFLLLIYFLLVANMLVGEIFKLVIRIKLVFPHLESLKMSRISLQHLFQNLRYFYLFFFTFDPILFSFALSYFEFSWLVFLKSFAVSC